MSATQQTSETAGAMLASRLRVGVVMSRGHVPFCASQLRQQMAFPHLPFQRHGQTAPQLICCESVLRLLPQVITGFKIDVL